MSLGQPLSEGGAACEVVWHDPPGSLEMLWHLTVGCFLAVTCPAEHSEMLIDLLILLTVVLKNVDRGQQSFAVKGQVVSMLALLDRWPCYSCSTLQGRSGHRPHVTERVWPPAHYLFAKHIGSLLAAFPAHS